MKRNTLMTLIVVAACALVSLVGWPYAFTVVPINEIEALAQSEAFDPVAYVDGIWASRIKPTVTDKAIDLAVILNAIHPDVSGGVAKDDLIDVTQQHGLITGGEAHVYMVKVSGTAVRVDTSKSVGLLEVAPEDYAGPIKVVIYLGPRIPSDETSIRDAVGFISFGDFKEQTEFGKVSTEINKRVNEEILSPLDKESLAGKQVVVFGAFTIRTFNLVTISLDQVNVVPVMIEIK